MAADHFKFYFSWSLLFFISLSTSFSPGISTGFFISHPFTFVKCTSRRPYVPLYSGHQAFNKHHFHLGHITILLFDTACCDFACTIKGNWLSGPSGDGHMTTQSMDLNRTIFCQNKRVLSFLYFLNTTFDRLYNKASSHTCHFWHVVLSCWL